MEPKKAATIRLKRNSDDSSQQRGSLGSNKVIDPKIGILADSFRNSSVSSQN